MRVMVSSKSQGSTKESWYHQRVKEAPKSHGIIKESRKHIVFAWKVRYNSNL